MTRYVAAILFALLFAAPAYAQLDEGDAATVLFDTSAYPQHEVLFDMFGNIQKATYAEVGDDALIDSDASLGLHKWVQEQNALLLLDLIEKVDTAAISPKLAEIVTGIKDLLDKQPGGRAATQPSTRAWPSNKIAYMIDDSIVDSRLKTNIRDAIAYWNSVAEVQFVPRANEGVYLRIRDAEGEGWNCSAQVGYKPNYGGHTSLNPPCTAGAIVHELLHVAGIMHEHQRSDRDAYLRMVPGAKTGTNFGIRDIGWSTEYDMCSIMLYAPMSQPPGISPPIYSLTDKGKAALAECKPKLSANCRALAPGQRCQLSDSDLLAIRHLYGTN